MDNGSRNAFDTLNDTLFHQMERLMNAKGDQLGKEIERSRSVSGLASNIISNHSNAINLLRFQAHESGVLDGKAVMPKMLGGGRP